MRSSRTEIRLSFLAIALALTLIPLNTRGQAYFELGDITKIYRLDHHVGVFLDSTNALTIDQVSHPQFAEFFHHYRENLTFGYTKPAIWLKVDTRCTTPANEWYLEIPAPFLEYVDFYQRTPDNSWEHTVSGYYRKQSDRAHSHTGHLLPLMFDSESRSSVYIRISGISPKTFTVKALERNTFFEKTRADDLGYGVFFGVLFVMLCYNLYLFVALRKKNYFLYALIIFLTFTIFSAISGYGGKFIWPEIPVFNFIYGKLAIELLIVCVTLYTIRFLHVKRYSIAMYYTLLSLIPLSAIALVLTATELLIPAGNHLITIATIIFITSGVVVRIRGNRTGAYFVAAWSFYFLGGLLLTLRNSGVLDFNFFTTHFVEIGAVLGVTLMGFGLGAEYRRLQKEKEAAQLVAYRAQQEDTARLEQKVLERTKQLRQANQELRRTLDTNKLQTQIIENKNAELDSFFYRVSHDLKGPVSSSLGLMALAKLDVKDEVALEYIEKQTSQLQRLSHIITGLVNLARLNNSSLFKEKIDFPRMVEECILSFNHTPDFERLRFETDIEDVDFYSEWTLVNAILQNLIENSIKYSRGESPYVLVRIYKSDEHLVIEVEDNGQGISEEHRTRIFELFYRASHHVEGTGLGLYILKRSVDRLKGDIDIKSEVDVGTTFTVRLPFDLQEQPAPSAQ